MEVLATPVEIQSSVDHRLVHTCCARTDDKIALCSTKLTGDFLPPRFHYMHRM